MIKNMPEGGKVLGRWLLVVVLLLPGALQALTLGSYQLHSYLDQPLDMDIALSGGAGLSASDVAISLASDEEFANAGIRKGSELGGLEFAVTLNDNGVGKVHVTSRDRISQPYVDFLLKARWAGGEIVRGYTILLDPVGYQQVGASAPVATSDASSTAADQGSAHSSQSQEAPRSSEPVVTSAPVPISSKPSRYQVKSGDTLWEIARQQRPNSQVSVQQMIVAIQDANPEAFYVRGNSNAIRAGAVLSIPDEAQITARSVAEAKQEIAQQNQRWQQLLRQQANDDGAASVQQIEPGTDQIDRRQADAAPVRGEVTLVADSAGDEGNGGTDENAAVTKDDKGDATLHDSVDRLQQENSELASRIDALKEQIATGDQLLAAREKQINALEQKIEALQKAVENNAKQTSAANNNSSKRSWQWLRDNLLWLAAVLIVLLLLIWLLLRRQQQSRDADLQLFVDDADDVAIDATASEAVTVAAISSDLADEDADDNDEGIDEDIDGGFETDVIETEVLPVVDSQPVNVTDAANAHSINQQLTVLMTYGNYAEAIALLRKAVAEDETDTDLKIKLLEVEKEAGEVTALHQDAERFRGTDVRVDETITRLVGDLTPTVVEDAEGDVTEAEPVTFDSVSQEGSHTMDVAPDNAEVAEKGADHNHFADDEDLDEVEAADALLDDNSIDFDFDEHFADMTPAESAADDNAVADDVDVLFDGFHDDISLEESDEEEAVVDSAVTAVDTSVEADDMEDDFAFDWDDDSADKETIAAAETESETVSLIDTTEPELADEVDSSDVTLVEDINAATDDFATLGTASAPSMADTPASRSSDFDFDLDEAFDFPDDMDENATRLDLARAYIDMGDKDGATDLLNEVVEEGDEQQKAEAQALLLQLQ